MANPRKFSDKLEIIRRKEEEANAAFVQIMREVSDARKTTGPVGVGHIPPQHNSWARSPNELMNMKQRFKGGSLPNVNMSQNPMAMQGAYPQMTDIYGNRQVHHPQQNFVGQNIGQAHLRRMDPSGPIYPSKNKRSYTVHASAPYRSNIHHQQPQSNNLLPDSDTGSMWRRTFSDSAIHQTLQQPPKKNLDGSMQQSSPRGINTSPISIPIENNETSFVGSPPVSYSSPVSYPTEGVTNGKNMQMAANTSSLPDLSNLSIPSPIQTPIDVEQENQNKIQQTSPSDQHGYPIPYRVANARRGVGKQIYSRQLRSNPDLLESIQREQKLNLNLFPGGVNMNPDKLDGSMNSNTSSSVSAPLSPVTPPPYYWNSTPMSPLATGDLIHQVSSQQSELQQQMSQFQIHSDNINNGMGNPPPYSYISESDHMNGYPFNKQNLYRINSGPTQLPSQHDSKLMCDRQLENELLKIKAQDNANNGELSEADLNSVQVALDPLDYQMLSGDNSQLVDQSAEEEFRLERASYQ